MIKVKNGVEFAVIAPAGFLILAALKDTSKFLGLDLTITSGTDGAHSGPLDPHKTGEAYDIRSQDFSPVIKVTVLSTIMTELGNRFYGFLESPGTSNEHFHIQRTRNTTFAVLDFLASN